MALTCPKCLKPLNYAPQKPTFEGTSDQRAPIKPSTVTGKIDLVCSDAKCKGRGTADLDEMRRQADDAKKSGNTAAAGAIRSEIRRLGFGA